ncbi:MAG: hypothetical protein WD534_11285 [Phycisphaeraceae bacterium]
MAWLHCDAPRWNAYQRLLSTVWPNATMDELEATAPGVHQMRGGVKLTVTDHYFRAVAKLGFHYYLTHTRRGFRGDEACFAPLRAFIMNGGDKNILFHNSGRTFAMPFGELPFGVLTPRQWGHVLASDETRTPIVVYVQMFVGQGCVPRPHYITLGAIENPVIAPSFAWGHVYVYDDLQQPGRFAGSVRQAQLTRIR